MAKKRGIVKHRNKASSGRFSKSRKAVKRQTKKSKKHETNFLKEVEKGFEKELYPPKHKGKFVIPIGIRVLIGYLFFLAALYMISLISGIRFPLTILFGQFITGMLALIINIILVVLIFFIIYGFYKRKAHAFDLSLAWFGFSTLNALVSLVLFKVEEHPLFKGLMLLSLVTLVLVNSVVIWYVANERKYFYARVFRVKEVQHQDKVFLYVVISFWVIAFMIGSIIGANFYSNTTTAVDSILLELQLKNPDNIYFFCMQKQGEQRDVCLLIAATMEDMHGAEYSKQQNIVSICQDIESDFYKFTCYRTLGLEVT